MSPATNSRAWSMEQTAIFSWFETPVNVLLSLYGSKHLVVRARAGCGKTTTILEGVNRAYETSILVCAFNQKIVKELVAKINNPYATVKTLHALGFACLRKFWPVGVEGDSQKGERVASLVNAVCDSRTPETIKRLVGQLCTKGREIAPHARSLGELRELMLTFDLMPDAEWESTEWDADFIEEKALAAMEVAATVKPPFIDFSDMIYLPVRNHWLTKTYDLVVVDEAQDMTVTQLEIALGVCKGRVAVVGDDRQAIYGFRGADSNSLDRLKEELNAWELGLTTTYRCGRVIVERAAQLVPDFNAGPNNPEGEIIQLTTEKLPEMAQPGDFVLSRTNAPLVSIAMTMLRSGKRARVAGRDIGAGLKALIRKVKGRSVPDTLARLAAWEAKQASRMEKAKRPDKIEMVHDQAAMIVSLAEGAQNVDELVTRIEHLFTDDGLGAAGVVTCSSVHRSKGLEADRVFVLMDTIRNTTQEEKNIHYVAITRAKRTLVLAAKPVAV